LLIIKAIIATDIESPAVSVQDAGTWGRKAEPDELPQLRHLSDTYWGYWVRDNPDIRNLHVYAAHIVLNEITVPLVVRALKSVNKDRLSTWPGDTFDADSDEGKALIGKLMTRTISPRA
jgi:hypothetical protein